MVMGNDAVFPIGVRIRYSSDINSYSYIQSYTEIRKIDIAGFKIVSGDRGINKSIVAKGILRNVGEYDKRRTVLLFP